MASARKTAKLNQMTRTVPHSARKPLLVCTRVFKREESLSTCEMKYLRHYLNHFPYRPFESEISFAQLRVTNGTRTILLKPKEDPKKPFNGKKGQMHQKQSVESKTSNQPHEVLFLKCGVLVQFGSENAKSMLGRMTHVPQTPPCTYFAYSIN